MRLLPKSPKARLAVLGIVCGVAGALVVALLSAGPYHWVEVKEGVLYRCGQLDGGDLREAILEHHVKTVVNLRAERGDWWAEEKRATEIAGAKHVDVDMPMGEPPTPEQVKTLLAIFDDPAARPVLFHCEHGVTRSAAVEGLWRREYLGETGEEALSRVARFGRDLEMKYPKIAAFIRDYVPRSAAPTPP